MVRRKNNDNLFDIQRRGPKHRRLTPDFLPFMILFHKFLSGNPSEEIHVHVDSNGR